MSLPPTPEPPAHPEITGISSNNPHPGHERPPLSVSPDSTTPPKKKCRWLSWPWKACVHSSRLCLGVINLVLAVMALVLGLIATYTAFKSDLPVPHTLTERIRKAARAEGLALQWEAIHLDLTGGLHLSGLNVNREGGDTRLISIPRAMADLSMVDLLLSGELVIDELRLDDALFYAPPETSPTGLNEPILERLTLQLERDSESWRIVTVQGRFANAWIHGVGLWPQIPADIQDPDSLSVQTPLPATATTVHPPSLAQRYQQAATRLVALIPLFENVEKPALATRMSLSPSGQPILEATFRGSQLSSQEGWTVQHFAVTAPSIHLPSLTMAEALQIDARILDFGPYGKATSLDGRLEVASLQPDSLAHPRHIRLAAREWKVREETVALPLVHLSLGEHTSRLRANAHAVLHGLPLKATANYHLSRRSGIINLEGRFNFDKILQRPELSRFNLQQWADAPGQILDLEVTADLAAQFQWRDFTFAFHLPQVAFKGSHFESISAQGKVYRDRVEVEHVSFKNPGYQIEGTFTQQYKPDAFRFILHGNLLPRDLNNLLGDWWIDIFERARFTQPTVRGSLEYAARWTNGGPHSFIFAGVDARGMEFDGVELDRTQLMIWRQFGFVELFDIHAHHSQGELEGNIAWLFPSRAEGLFATNYDLDSRLPFEVVSKLGGQEAQLLQNDLQFTSNPHLRVKGTNYRHPETGNRGKTATVKAIASTPLTYRGFPLDTLEFDGIFTTTAYYLNSVRFTLGEGTGELAFYLQETEDSESSQARFRIALREVPWEPLTGAFQKMFAEESPALTDDPNPPVALPRYDPAMAETDPASLFPTGDPFPEDTPTALNSSLQTRRSFYLDGDTVAAAPAAADPLTRALIQYTAQIEDSSQRPDRNTRGRNPFRDNDSTNVEEPPVQVSASKPLGSLTFDLQAEGIWGDMASYHGNGSILLTEASLGQIRLFGGLTRVFESVGIPLGRLTLTDAQSTFRLRGPKLTFPDLELTGPALTIQANGDVTLPEQTLNFSVNVFFLRTSGLNLANLFGSLFSPFGYVFEVLLSGDLNEPDWRLRLDPRNLFSTPESRAAALDDSQDPGD